MMRQDGQIGAPSRSPPTGSEAAACLALGRRKQLPDGGGMHCKGISGFRAKLLGCSKVPVAGGQRNKEGAVETEGHSLPGQFPPHTLHGTQ